MRSFLKILVFFLISSGASLLMAQEKSASGIFTIDGFDNPNAYKNYLVHAGDQSMLSLAPSSDRLNGLYSLELTYFLKTTLPSGTYVSLQRIYPANGPLNIKSAFGFSISVKGDGSGNDFKISFTDGDDENWEYEDKDMLNSVKWETLELKASDFRLSDTSRKKNGIFDMDSIKGYTITVFNQHSTTAEGVAVKSSQGIILVDNFRAYVPVETNKAVTEEIPQVKEKEKEKTAAVVSPAAENPLRIGGAIYNEYFNVPDTINDLRHWARIDFAANYDKFTAKAVFSAEAQSFGNAAYSLNENEKYTGQVVQNYPSAIVPFIQVKANNLSEYLSDLTVGNLFFEYSRYTFSPTIGYDDIWGLQKVTPDWGYKGLSAEGNLQILNYHAFIIKQSLDSFTFGTRLSRHIGRVNKIYLTSLDVKFYYVYSSLTAAYTNDNSVRQTGWDQVASLDLAMRFFDNAVGFEGFYAVNDYLSGAQVNYADPLKPVYQQPLAEKVLQDDNGYKGKIIFDSLFIKNFYLTYEFRHMGQNFKPRNRSEPILFDDIDSDQNGHNFLASYRLKGFVLTGEFDTLKRISDTQYYRNRVSGGLTCSMLQNLFLSYHIEWKREYYEYVSMRSAYNTGRNDIVLTQELYLKAQLRYNLDLGINLRNEDVNWPSENKNFNTQAVYLRSDYYPANNLHVFAETRMTRFGDPTWYSPGYDPFVDNFVRIGAMFNF